MCNRVRARVCVLFLRALQRGRVLEAVADDRKLAVQYGERQRIIDLSHPTLSTFFRVPAPSLWSVGDRIEYRLHTIDIEVLVAKLLN